MEIILTDANFQKEVLEAKLPVVVDFWAPWCGPCKMMAPILGELAKEFDGRVIVAKMNVDENQTQPGSFKVMSIPTLVFFKDGVVVDQQVGALPKVSLAEKIKRLLE